MWYVHTMKYYTALKKKKILLFATTQVWRWGHAWLPDVGVPSTADLGWPHLAMWYIGKQECWEKRINGSGSGHSTDGRPDHLKWLWIVKGGTELGVDWEQYCSLCTGVWLLLGASCGTCHCLLHYWWEFGGHFCSFPRFYSQTGPRTSERSHLPTGALGGHASLGQGPLSGQMGLPLWLERQTRAQGFFPFSFAVSPFPSTLGFSWLTTTWALHTSLKSHHNNYQIINRGFEKALQSISPRIAETGVRVYPGKE